MNHDTLEKLLDISRKMAENPDEELSKMVVESFKHRKAEPEEATET